MSCAASGFGRKLQSRAESLNIESLVIRSRKSGMTRAKGRAASGFRPKLQSRAESLSLESLDKVWKIWTRVAPRVASLRV